MNRSQVVESSVMFVAVSALKGRGMTSQKHSIFPKAHIL